MGNKVNDTYISINALRVEVVVGHNNTSPTNQIATPYRHSFGSKLQLSLVTIIFICQIVGITQAL